MTPQETYNKGLDDAENNVIETFKNILMGKEAPPFPNPELEKVRKAVQGRTDYYLDMSRRDNNIGKGFRNKIEEEQEILGIRYE